MGNRNMRRSVNNFRILQSIEMMEFVMRLALENKDKDIALLKEAMLDMQRLLKNAEKLAEISRGACAASAWSIPHPLHH
jgi:hypothetical protein